MIVIVSQTGTIMGSTIPIAVTLQTWMGPGALSMIPVPAKVVTQVSQGQERYGTTALKVMIQAMAVIASWLGHMGVLATPTACIQRTIIDLGVTSWRMIAKEL